MLTNRNQLPPLEAVERPSFEVLWEKFKADFLGELLQLDPVAAAEAELALQAEGELMAKMGQAFCQYIISHIERINEQARQMLPGFARATNLDHVVAFQSLERQILSPGDPSALPPVPEVRETDDHLLLRYWLAPHAPAAGSRLSYRYHCLTLGQRPLIELDKPDSKTVVVTYTLPESSIASAVKDANATRTAPGEVTLTILSSEGDGLPGGPLLEEVEEYFGRDDVKPETDTVIVQGPEVLNYSIDVVCQVQRGPDTEVIKDLIQQLLDSYALEKHALGQKILRSYITYLLHKAGAVGMTINQPVDDISASPSQAPYCTGINVTVQVI